MKAIYKLKGISFVGEWEIIHWTYKIGKHVFYSQAFNELATLYYFEN